jgi:hypothetical protein
MQTVSYNRHQHRHQRYHPFHCLFTRVILRSGMDGGDLARMQIVSTVEGSRRRLLITAILQSSSLHTASYDPRARIVLLLLHMPTLTPLLLYSAATMQLPVGKPPLPSQAASSGLAHSNASASASYPAPLSAAAASSAAAAALGDQQNWLWKYRLSASRYCCVVV